MKTTRTLGIVALLIAALVVGYSLGFQQGARVAHDSASIRNLKQIGLAFRHGRNDVAEPFPAHQ